MIGSLYRSLLNSAGRTYQQLMAASPPDPAQKECAAKNGDDLNMMDYFDLDASPSPSPGPAENQHAAQDADHLDHVYGAESPEAENYVCNPGSLEPENYGYENDSITMAMQLAMYGDIIDHITTQPTLLMA